MFTQVFPHCPSVVGVYELGCHLTSSPVMAEFRFSESRSLSWRLDETEQELLTEVVLMSVKLSSELLCQTVSTAMVVEVGLSELGVTHQIPLSPDKLSNLRFT